MERRRLDGTVLATQITRVTDRQGSRPRWFWRPPWSLSVTPPRRFWCSAPTGQVLLGSFTIRPGSSPGPQQDSLEASIEAEECGYRLTLTARAYAPDVFCMVDKVDPAASTDGGMATILPGPAGRCLSAWHFPPPLWLPN